MVRKTINWLEEVTIRKQELLGDIERLLVIPSVKGEATDIYPVGEGPYRALREMMKMGEEAGFQVQDFGKLVGRLDWGAEGLEPFAILGHVDVVPVGEGWTSDPFTPTYKDGKLYARGSLDDKGPLVCAFFAVKLLKDLGFVPKKQVQIIVGTDEESDWKCMESYQKQAKLPKQGFVPDAYFPIVNGEKGVAHLLFSYQKDNSNGNYCLAQFESGLKENMVPSLAQAQITGEKVASMAVDFQEFLNVTGFSGQCHVATQKLQLTLNGKAAHGSTPQKGMNAATYLAAFLATYDFGQGAAKHFLHTLGIDLHQAYDGEKLGIASQDEKMGALTCNLGRAMFSAENGGKLIADIRYPKSITIEQMQKALQTVFASPQQYQLLDKKQPHYVSGDSPLVQSLLRIYEEQTGEKGDEQVIGGATYARLLKEGVAFGALFPNTQDTMHQANESIPVEDLLRATAIYAQALSELLS